VERQCDDGEGRRWLNLGARAKEGDKELGSEEKRCGVLWGDIRPFIGAEGEARRR
jgi:hypothetical protein